MPLLLNIDTATEHASVCLSETETVLAMEQSADQKNHASFIQPAIRKLLWHTGLSLQLIDAVAVTAGPGSYTGLRVGMATAKGLCYALQKPLILINTLEVMAYAVIEEKNKQLATSNFEPQTSNFLFCPMIDARRMEVFTALYNNTLQVITEPVAMVLDEKSFEGILLQKQIIFSGSGYAKFQKIINHPNAFFSTAAQHAGHLAVLAGRSFLQKKFADIAYCEPFYLKEFFTKQQPL